MDNYLQNVGADVIAKYQNLVYIYICHIYIYTHIDICTLHMYTH